MVFQTAPGVTVPFPERIKEEFEVYDRSITANVSYEKLAALVNEFYKALPEPLFFVLELPLTLREQMELGYGNKTHREVLYLDGQKQQQIDDIMDVYGELLLSDGMSEFAIASHKNRDEIYIQKYKLVSIYSVRTHHYAEMLKRYGLKQTKELSTVWQTFSKSHPGECQRIPKNGMGAHDVANVLKRYGMYRAKIVEDPKDEVEYTGLT